MANIFHEQKHITPQEAELVDDTPAQEWADELEAQEYRHAMRQAYGRPDGADLQAELARGVKDAIRKVNDEESK